MLYQKKFLSDAFVAGANKFVFYVALPVQLFRDLAATDVRAAFDGAYVLFCFVVTLVSILGIWALAKLFLPDKRLVGEFVQVCYRSSAAILGTAFLQSIYGTAEMSSMMILGSVPLYNVMAVVILMLEGPEAAQAGSMTAKLKKSVKGILTNPTLLGIAAGFAWSLLGLPMPTMAGKTLSSIASLTSPLALLAIGAGFKGRKALGYLRPTAVATAVKLMALPALFLPVICQKPAYNIYIIRSSCHHFRHLHGNNLLQEINIHLILLTVKQQILINAKIYPLAYAFFKISVNTLGCLLKAIFFYQ